MTSAATQRYDEGLSIWPLLARSIREYPRASPQTVGSPPLDGVHVFWIAFCNLRLSRSVARIPARPRAAGSGFIAPEVRWSMTALSWADWRLLARSFMLASRTDLLKR
jgi:hypothetical protein